MLELNQRIQTPMPFHAFLLASSTNDRLACPVYATATPTPAIHIVPTF